MKRAMIDIETLGTGVDAIITQVGIVTQEDHRPTDKLSVILDLREQERLGRRMDVATLVWWLNLDHVDHLVEVAHFQKDLTALDRNVDAIVWMLRGCDEVWANSPSFDVAILNSLLKQYNYQPISHKIERDFRTARSLHPEIEYVYPEDCHDALVDAEAQARHLRDLGIWPVLVLDGEEVTP